MAPSLVISADADGALKVLHVGENSSDAESAFEEARKNTETVGLFLFQNVQPRLSASPKDEAANIANAAAEAEAAKLERAALALASAREKAKAASDELKKAQAELKALES